jgi:hypothetical protein
MEYTKMDALRILSHAYWYLAGIHGYREGVLYDKFNHVRRSMTIEDTKYEGKAYAEGYNGHMPTFF